MSTILFYPIADKCRNQCLYCFEDPSFKNTNSVFDHYDKTEMAKTLERLKLQRSNKNSGVILHGGEIFDLPIKDFEFFISEIAKYQERPQAQSSLGVPLSSEHIRILKKYNVNLGISVDGPKDFNILRGPRTPEANEIFQTTVYDNIKKLKDNGIQFGCICLLSRVNATADKIDKLIEWCVINTHGGRFNQLFTPWHDRESEIAKYALTPKELTFAFKKLTKATIDNSDFEFTAFKEVKSALLGDFKTVCTFSRCDYLTTGCTTILPDGHLARCDRCFQDGYYYAAEHPTPARSRMLEQTECKGCKYFVACAGGCPGEGLNGDFRSKSMYCESLYALFQDVENILRKTFPGIFLTIDIHNYYEDYVTAGKRFNPFARDQFFVDTKSRMVNEIKLLGWTPEKEKEEQQNKSGRPGESRGTPSGKHGYAHSDCNNS